MHTSCEQSHEAIRRARQKGMRVWGEPLIQHLTLDESEYAHPDWDHAARRVMSPPFRNKLHQDSLWAGLSAGSLQVVATDHCAFTTEQKRYGVGDFTKIPNGTGGLEDRMPMLWTYGVATGRLTPERICRRHLHQHRQDLETATRRRAPCWSAPTPISWSGTRKNPRPSPPGRSSLLSITTCFEGKEVKGLPRFTLTRGHVAVHDGEIRTQEGHGKFVAREPVTPTNKALSTWKELTFAAQGRTQRHSGERGVMRHGTCRQRQGPA